MYLPFPLSLYVIQRKVNTTRNTHTQGERLEQDRNGRRHRDCQGEGKRAKEEEQQKFRAGNKYYPS
jgi:hypothetical protein